MPPYARMRPERRNLMTPNASKPIDCDATRPCRRMHPKLPNPRRCHVGERIPNERLPPHLNRPCLPDALALFHVPVLQDATALPDAMPNGSAFALPDALALLAQHKQANTCANATERRHNKTIKATRQDKTSANATERSRK